MIDHRKFSKVIATIFLGMCFIVIVYGFTIVGLDTWNIIGFVTVIIVFTLIILLFNLIQKKVALNLRKEHGIILHIYGSIRSVRIEVEHDKEFQGSKEIGIDQVISRTKLVLYSLVIILPIVGLFASVIIYIFLLKLFGA